MRTRISGSSLRPATTFCIRRQAQSSRLRASRAAINASEFVLDVGSYTRAARAKILFNHLHFSDISEVEREALLADDFFLKIIDHKQNFNPRLIDLLKRRPSM